MHDTHPYRPDIDVLRAIAVLPVVLFHLQATWIDGGYLGVDVFFVISGFLITRIIIGEMREDRFSFRSFYARRIRRILPALLAVVLTVLVVTNLSCGVDQCRYVAGQSLAALGSFANVYFWLYTGDYWGPSAETTELLHTWSLSVEEQFYFVFPVVVYGSTKAGGRWLVVVLTSTFAISLTLFVFGVIEHPRAAFYLLPPRAWELASGAMLAVWTMRQPAVHASREITSSDRWSRIVDRGYGSVIGIGLIGFAYFSTSNTRSVDLNAIAAVAGSVLFIANPGTNGPCRLLNQAVLVYIGRASYSIYLWHWPVIVFWRRFVGDLNPPVVFAATLGLGCLSYHLIEQTTRRRPGIISWIGLSFVLVTGVAVGTAYINRRIVIDVSAYATPIWYGEAYNVSAEPPTSSWFRDVTEGVDVPPRQAPMDAIYNGGVVFGPGEFPEVVLLGDSHATMWARQFQKLVEKYDLRGAVWAVNGTPPGFTEDESDPVRSTYVQSRRELISKWNPNVVLIAARWSQVNWTEMTRLIDFATQNAAHVLLIEQAPELPIGDENLIRFLAANGIPPIDGKKTFLTTAHSDALMKARQQIHELAEKYPNCTVVPIFDSFAKFDRVWVLSGNQAIYLDDDHLTEFGTSQAIENIEAALKPLLEPNVPSRSR